MESTLKKKIYERGKLEDLILKPSHFVNISPYIGFCPRIHRIVTRLSRKAKQAWEDNFEMYVTAHKQTDCMGEKSFGGRRLRKLISQDSEWSLSDIQKRTLKDYIALMPSPKFIKAVKLYVGIDDLKCLRFMVDTLSHTPELLNLKNIEIHIDLIFKNIGLYNTLVTLLKSLNISLRIIKITGFRMSLPINTWTPSKPKLKYLPFAMSENVNACEEVHYLMLRDYDPPFLEVLHRTQIKATVLAFSGENVGDCPGVPKDFLAKGIRKVMVSFLTKPQTYQWLSRFPDLESLDIICEFTSFNQLPVELADNLETLRFGIKQSDENTRLERVNEKYEKMVMYFKHNNRLYAFQPENPSNITIPVGQELERGKPVVCEKYGINTDCLELTLLTDKDSEVIERQDEILSMLKSESEEECAEAPAVVEWK